MHLFEEKLEKIKAMHTSNFIFWIFGKFLIGLGIGILLPVYIFNTGWVIAGWMLIIFAIIIQIPAFIAAHHEKRHTFQKRGKM